MKIRSQEVEEQMRDALPGGVNVNSGEDASVLCIVGTLGQVSGRTG